MFTFHILSFCSLFHWPTILKNLIMILSALISIDMLSPVYVQKWGSFGAIYLVQNWILSEKLTPHKAPPSTEIGWLVGSHVGGGVERWTGGQGGSALPTRPVPGGSEGFHLMPQWTVLLSSSHHLQDTRALQQICMPPQTGNYWFSLSNQMFVYVRLYLYTFDSIFLRIISVKIIAFYKVDCFPSVW